jgi:xylan 1,4-beta-xylosidase
LGGSKILEKLPQRRKGTKRHKDLRATLRLRALVAKIHDMKKIFSIIVLLAALNTNAQQTYSNPILSGFYPDPSICRVGDDYYIVNSSFAYFPGLPVFHSKDLVSWKQIGHAMDRPEQLDLKGAGVSRGLFAPSIRFHKGTYYIICTLIDKGGNFVITAKDPKGPWSNPVWLKEVNGIDPALYFDEDGRSYVLFNSIPPNNISMHDGHRTIRMFEFDAVNLKVKGEEKLLINGGTDMAKKPVWIEGPHIFKKDAWYYLICAEGGTGYNHSEVVFRSKTIEGPYISYEKNPILTQRHLSRDRNNPITTTGHADFVETPGGKWYAVFLGCRPYEDDHYNTGRETFMTPVEWRDGWPIINPGYEEVQYHYPLPLPANTKKLSNDFSGNFFFKDEFNNAKLNYRWEFLRAPEEQWHSLTERKNSLSVKLLPQTCSSKENPAFLGFRQQHIKGYAATAMDFKAAAENEKAGLIIFQNETHFYFLCQSVQNNTAIVELYRSVANVKEGRTELLGSQLLPGLKNALQLKIEAKGNKYAFYYAMQKGRWTLFKDDVDAKFLSTKTAGGFVGCMYGLYATSTGIKTNNKVYFNWFETRANDELYNDLHKK